jgi:hypothetical protein
MSNPKYDFAFGDRIFKGEIMEKKRERERSPCTYTEKRPCEDKASRWQTVSQEESLQ